MRALFLIISAGMMTCQSFAQNPERSRLKNNELKVNTLYLLGGYPEVAYERTLSNRSAIGASLGIMIGSPKSNYATDILTYDFGFVPNYRYYFGRKRAAGFFMEVNSAVFYREPYWETKKEWGIGLGMGIGAKFLTMQNWSIGFVAGGGYNLLQESCADSFLCFPDVYPRLGITAGKRF